MAVKRNRIPDRLREEIATQIADGKTTRQIRDWLASTHSLVVGHATVIRYTAKIRDERKTVASAAMVEGLRDHVNSDLDHMRALEEDLMRRLPEASNREAAALANAMCALLNLKTKLSGAQQSGLEGVRGGVIVLPAEEP